MDDHALFRESLSRLLEAEPGIELAGACGTNREALEFLRTKPVDVILLDFDLGHETGRQLLAALNHLRIDHRVLMLTAGMSDLEAVDAIRRGVAGIFLKHSPPSLLLEAIRKVAAGETWLDQRFMSAVMMAARPETLESKRPFTDRERIVLRCVFEGLSNKEIAERLGVSESSVKATLQQLFHKTGVRTRSQLVRIALERYSTEM